MTNTVVKRRLSVFFQLALFVGVLMAVVVLRPPEPGGGVQKIWSTLGRLCVTLFSKAELWATSRLGKALGLGLVAGIGLQMGGVTAAWFIAGWALALGWLFRTTPLLIVLLAMPMVPWDASVIRVTLFVVGTGVVMFIVEKKLHWYLYLKPGLASGLILPEIHGSEQEGGGVSRLFGGMVTMLRAVVALVCLGLIAGALWVFVPSYQQQQERKKTILAATDFVEKGETKAATKKLIELEQKFPNEPKFTRKTMT
jgi:hypothetical protein